MPRNMSFMLTTDQVRDRSKTVTRRLGWYDLKVGDLVIACEKCQGLKKGEKIKKIVTIKIESVRTERLEAIDHADCVAEGFPDLSPAEFVEMFCRNNDCYPYSNVNRIQFSYVDIYDLNDPMVKKLAADLTKRMTFKGNMVEFTEIRPCDL